VIGINSAIASGTGYYAGYGFAIPITLAKDVMDDLIKYGKIRRAVLGVFIADVDAELAEVAGLKQISGAVVNGFSADEGDSPAAMAGLKVGDVIVSANGQQVDKVATLQRVIRGFEPGESVNVEVMRYGERRSFRVRLAEQPATPTLASAASTPRGRAATEPTSTVASRKLGITAATLTAQQAQQLDLPADHRTGVLVTGVNARGTAYGKLFPNQSLIEKVLYPTQREIRTVSDLDQVLASARAGSVIQFLVFDGGQSRPVSIRVP
jgi:serine protease Do